MGTFLIPLFRGMGKVTHLIFTILNFLLILNIKFTNNRYIYNEKFTIKRDLCSNGTRTAIRLDCIIKNDNF